MIRLDQVGSTGAVDRKRMGRRRQTGLEIGEPTDSLSTLSAWYYRSQRAIQCTTGGRERENLPIRFYHSASISEFRPPFSSPLFIQRSASRNIFANFVFAAPFHVCSLEAKGGGSRHISCPRFASVFHFPRWLD